MARRSSAIVRYKRVASARRTALGEALLRAAVFLLTTHKANVSVPNPYPHTAPSRPGQYPRLRTGFGRAGYSFTPATAREVAAQLTPRCVVGVSQQAAYMEWLVDRGRKGIKATMDENKSRVRAIIDAEMKKPIQ